MSQQGGAWQTATNRPRNSQSSSRTPQNRSSTASPSQQGQPTQPPKNVWTQNRSSTPSGVNGPTKGDVTPGVQEDAHQPINGFNATEVKAFLGRNAVGQSYKVTEAGGAGGRGSGSAWGAKPNTMANGQPFFVQLAKQVATTEGGG